MADQRKRGRQPKAKESGSESQPIVDESGIPIIKTDDDLENTTQADNPKDEPVDTPAPPPADTTSKDPILQDPVVENEHTKANATIKGHMPLEIEEPVIEQPIIDFTPQPAEETASEETTETEEVSEEPPGDVRNPALDGASNKEKNLSAKYLVEACINAYVLLNDMGKSYCSFKSDKLDLMAATGKVDLQVLDIQLPTQNGPITIGAFLDMISQKSEEIFVVSDEFKAKATELLTKIFKEKGWGITPMQALIILVAEDAVPKVAAIFEIRGQFNMLIKIGTQILTQQKKKTLEVTHTEGPAPKPGEPIYTPTEEVSAEEISSEKKDAAGKTMEPA